MHGSCVGVGHLHQIRQCCSRLKVQSSLLTRRKRDFRISGIASNRSKSSRTTFQVARSLSGTGLPTHMHMQLLEGVALQTRPDSSQNLILYTHMLCPYAQRSLLTLLFKVSPPDGSVTCMHAVRECCYSSSVHCLVDL